MQTKKLDDTFSVREQLLPEEMAEVAALGFRSIINNRPDGEGEGQPTSDEIAAAAGAAGLEYRHIPVVPGQITEEGVAQFDHALTELPKPILGFCRTGTRAGQMYEAVQTLRAARPSKRFQVVIAGGGSAGIATAASMLRRRPDLQIGIVEPSEQHYYQPGWTLVGGGVFAKEETCRREETLIPDGVTWIKAAVTGFDPASNSLSLDDGSQLGYDLLVVAMGNRLAWDEIEGLEETLGQNGVTSNYRYDLAPYTWQLVQSLDKGRALFTQPAMPIKCAGAPQKAMYLSCSEWKRRGVLGDIEVEFHNQGAAIFGVKEYVPALMETVEKYGIDLEFGSNLVRVDGSARKAWFKTESGEVERDFDMLHVCPPQKGNKVVAASQLADAAGYAEVDQSSLQHVRYPNVFALGDCGSTPNAKTMAAARKQAPVAAANGIAVLEGKAPMAVYDGYGSCPLTVEHGKIVLAEFLYGGKVAPTFPTWLIDGTRPSRLAWWLKAEALPPIYWHGMLKGREWLTGPAA